MTGEEFKAGAITLFGARGWQRKVAQALHTYPATVRRWTSGKVPVPGPARAYMELRLEMEERQ